MLTAQVFSTTGKCFYMKRGHSSILLVGGRACVCVFARLFVCAAEYFSVRPRASVIAHACAFQDSTECYKTC